VEDIARVPGVPTEVAQAVYDALRAWGEEAQTVADKADGAARGKKGLPEGK
jgi:excinuclease ABC subunit C